MRCVLSYLSQFDISLYSYIIDYHVAERALKERYIKGQSVRAVIFVDMGGGNEVCRTDTYSLSLQVSHLQRSFNHASIE